MLPWHHLWNRDFPDNKRYGGKVGRDTGAGRMVGSAMKAAVLAGMMLAGLAAPAAAASDADARLKQAAQHFADMEDDQAKSILDDLSAQGVAEADVLLGYLYADLLYEGRDYVAAVAAFRRAADADNEEATFQLAEGRFWPDYSDWTLTVAEEAVRPSPDEVFHLLQSVFAAHEVATFEDATKGSAAA